MISASDISEANLAYYTRLRGNKQWSGFLLTLVREMFASAGSADVGEFLRHVGRCMAQKHAVPEEGTLESLEASINNLWREMDWGWARLGTDGQAIEIVHGAYPVLSDDVDWHQALAALLEGVYQQWFMSQDDDLKLRVHFVGLREGALVFNCGG
jgi:hypothetical protein